jgi:hypothetical protein
MRYLLAQKNIFALMSNKPDLALSNRIKNRTNRIKKPGMPGFYYTSLIGGA